MRGSAGHDMDGFGVVGDDIVAGDPGVGEEECTDHSGAIAATSAVDEHPGIRESSRDRLGERQVRMHCR